MLIHHDGERQRDRKPTPIGPEGCGGTGPFSLSLLLGMGKHSLVVGSSNPIPLRTQRWSRYLSYRPLVAGRIGCGTMRLLLGILVAASAEAQLSISGEWAGRYHEDFDDRVPGDVNGDFTGVPINDAARRYAEAWDVRRVNNLEHQCQPYSLPHIYRGPLQFRIWEEKHPDTQEIIAYNIYIGTYMQSRTIWMDGRPHPPPHAPHTFMGFSTGRWEGDILTVETTHIKKEFYRRSGLPSSDRTTVVEHYIRHGNLLSHVLIITDPVYLTEPYITSQEFERMDRGNQNWLYNCEYVMEIPRPKNDVPHFLPGQNPVLDEWAEKFGLPFEAVFAGAEATYPDYVPRLEELTEQLRNAP